MYYFMFRNEIVAVPRFQLRSAHSPQHCVVITSEVGKWRNWILCFAPCRSPHQHEAFLIYHHCTLHVNAVFF